VNPLTVWYSHDQEDGDLATTPEQLDASLDRIAALSGPDWPALATVTQVGTRFGPVLYVGFHLDRGALLYAGLDAPDSSYTKGEGSAEGEPLLYMYMTSDNEFPPNSEVSAALVRQAAHEFADTGERPTCVEWQTWEPEIADSGSEWPAL
jgi:immunity protein Imm1 of predicted polymorphic toxin system